MKNKYIEEYHESKTRLMAVSGPFQIELMEYVGTNDYKYLIEISKTLVKEYGKIALLTPNTIQTYFNKNNSLPFIARFQGEIIGYIIGIPLESLNREPWVLLDIHYKKYNTIYTYAFVINKKHTKNGYAKMLKRVYLNWAKKQEGILYITGHVMEGISKKFKGDITVINKTKNWQGTSKTFEYYRRKLN